MANPNPSRESFNPYWFDLINPIPISLNERRSLVPNNIFPILPSPPPFVRPPFVAAAPRQSESKNDLELKVDNDEQNKYIRSDQYVDYDKLSEDNLECSICLNIIDGTVAVTTCLHKFCSSCLYQYLMQKVGGACCPNCRSPIDVDDIMLSPELTDKLDQTLIKCKNRDCNKQHIRKEYKKHIVGCEFNKKQCKGCKSLIFVNKFEAHEEECEHRQVKCNLCNVYVKFYEQKEHRDELCPHTMIKCPNKKCNYMTQRFKMKRHTPQCTFSITFCNNGCGAQFDGKQTSEHNEVCDLRPVECEFCDIMVRYNVLDVHYSLCPQREVECVDCQEKILFGTKDKHDTRCEKKRIICPLGCNMELERCDYKKTHINVCVNRRVECDVCGQLYINSKEREHQNICQDMMIECSDCSRQIKRMELTTHSKVCGMKVIECKYSYAGCECMFLRKNSDDHYNDYKDLHLQSLDEFIKRGVKFSSMGKKNDFFSGGGSSYPSRGVGAGSGVMY